VVTPLSAPQDGPPAVEIDAARVAEALGLPVDVFRERMSAGKVAVLCEKGIDDDAGLYRATFYFEQRRARFVVDASGRPV
jgi:hypothetical protein